MNRSKPPMKRTITEQIIDEANSEPEQQKEYDGDIEHTISTGSTLLDLIITGGRTHYGGLPGGIIVEIFGQNSSGKTVLLCEIAGNVQRKGGVAKFNDPEARLNKQFATLFNFNVDPELYFRPNTIAEAFAPIKIWEVPDVSVINGLFSDSLAALSTETEMNDEKGDKAAGLRRSKEMSEEMRKICRLVADKNLLVVCSNQVRQNVSFTPNPYAPKYRTSGGEALGFYASVRLRCVSTIPITKKVKLGKQEYKNKTGIETEIEVFKNTTWKPYRRASIIIDYDYGIDDISANLKYNKYVTGASTYLLDGTDKLGRSLDEAVQTVEQAGLENDVREETIRLWNKIEAEFMVKRLPKKRW